MDSWLRSSNTWRSKVYLVVPAKRRASVQQSAEEFQQKTGGTLEAGRAGTLRIHKKCVWKPPAVCFHNLQLQLVLERFMALQGSRKATREMRSISAESVWRTLMESIWPRLATEKKQKTWTEWIWYLWYILNQFKWIIPCYMNMT